VKHTAVNAYGRDTEIKTNYITIESTVPNADFSASVTSGNAPLTVKFTDKSTGSPTAWKWSFGDGSALVTEYNPTHTYTKAGTYTVKETVSNDGGKDTEIKTNYITVKAAPVKAPVAAFSVSTTSGKAPLKVQFTDKSTNSPTSWKWSFGDGTYSTSKSPSHTYSKAGRYTVYLTVKNAAGSNTKIISGYITVK
jgi:PKD repeat protein